MGEHSFEITYRFLNELKTHTVPAVVVTKVLNTKEDIDSFTAWADAYNGTTGDDIYDGYFVLGQDINYSGTYVPSMVIHTDNIGDENLGFRGVFDGMGHTVNGMYVESANWSTDHGTSAAYRRTGFISVLHKKGVIKNVAFTNAKVKYCSFLSACGEGLIENVYVGYTGDTNDSWNCTVNPIRDNARSAVTVHNAVITYDTAWEKGNILGKINDGAKTYRNVYIVGSGSNIVSYYSNLQGKDGVISSIPLGDDNFACYSSSGEMLAERKNEIAEWNYFSATATQLSFGTNGKLLSSAAIEKDFSGNTLISADGKSSDYIIVYEEDNDFALNAASFIAEHIYRASGTVTYSAISGGRFSETVNGGVLLKMTTQLPQNWSENSSYIIIGNSDISNAPVADAGRYIIKTVGNTIFINADIDEEYITAAIAFLREILGYNALSDDTVFYDKVNGSAVITGDIDIDFDSAFNVRSSTNAHLVWKNEQLGFNGRNRFPIGPTDENGIMQPFHNTVYWLNYSENSTAHPNWFRNDGSDICYAAGGEQNNYNAEYLAMVATAAENIRNLLNSYPDVTDVTFSLRDNDLVGCTCAVCKANHTNAAVKFLNDVVAKIQSLDGNKDRKFTIYMLAYYYLIDAPTIEMNEHLGVIYAPARNGFEAVPIYSSQNESVRNQISAWVDKTKNIGFWFYGTLFHNYMIPTDTVRSLLSWFEYSARTVKAAGADPVYMYVNGQTRERNSSAFEAFKQYAFSKAQVEILEKVKLAPADEYYAQLDAYVLELESEFFGFTVDGDDKIFRDGGYYGAAKANEAMYNLYTKMKTDYAAIKENNDGTTYEYIDTIQCSVLNKYNTLNDYLNGKRTDGYWLNFKADTIKEYMGYIETAQNAIAAYSGNMKAVYERHILIESLTPKFMMCVAGGSGKSGYGFKSGYNGTDITTLRKNLKSDFELLGREYYGEHYKLADLYSNWGI